MTSTRTKNRKNERINKQYKKLMSTAIIAESNQFSLAELISTNKLSLEKIYRETFNLPKTPNDIKFKEHIQKLKGLFTVDEWHKKGFRTHGLAQPAGQRFNGLHVFSKKQVTDLFFNRKECL